MKKEKVDIFKLYKPEVTEKLSDNYGNSAEVLIIKPTSDQMRSASEYFDTIVEAEKADMVNKSEEIRKTYALLPRENLITLILRLEAPYVSDIIDLAPSEDGALKKYEDKRKEDLSKETDENLRKYAVDLSVESKAKIKAIAEYGRYMLAMTCLSVDKRKPLFSINKEDSNYIGNLSQDVIDKLTKKRYEIIATETKGDVRRAAKDPNFT